MRRFFLGADIGGTFTDVVLAGADGSLSVAKQLTTPDAPERAVLEAVARVLAAGGARADEVVRVVHGTTLAANAVLEHKVARVAFVTTEGFGDLLRIGREMRVEDDRYDLHFTPAPPRLARAQIFEARERTGPRGEIVSALGEAHASELARAVASQTPEAVAVCLLHSYANPAHEQLLESALRAALPGATIVTSSRVCPEMREFDRACTTLFAAEVAPLLARYLVRLEAGLRDLGICAPLQIMESSGGVMSAGVAAARAVATLESGAAAGVMAAARLALHYGIERAISFDMGGTTAKAGVVHAGQPRLVRELHVSGRGSFGGRRQGTGLPVKIPAIDLAEVGAGGGSIAWLDPEGILRVGPRSAGSDPGPACYGRGGTLPTVTDADLVLGYLDPDRFAGGTLALDRAAALRAIEEHVARPLGVDAARAAWAIHEAVNANMAAAIHVVTVQRGIDPRDHAVVAFGGAGPMHLVGVARHFGITRLLVPPDAGVASALGMLGTDLVAEHGRTLLLRPDELDLERASALFADLEGAALEKMGFAAAAAPPRAVERLVDARFEGQAHELAVPVPSLTAVGLAAVEKEFRERYRAAYGIEPHGRVEYSALRVKLSVAVEKPPVAVGSSGAPRTTSPRTRPAFFGDAGFVPTTALERADLEPGVALEGPAILEGRVDTIVVPPGWSARADAAGAVWLESIRQRADRPALPSRSRSRRAFW
jgi:N-methylhydantoinase A